MKVPKARKLSSGTWFIYMRLNGEGVSVTGETEKECTRKAEMIKAEYRNGKRQEKRSDITLTKAIDEYIKSRDAVLSPSTIRGYRTIQRTRFQSAMEKPISGAGWQQLVNAEAKLCAPKTIKNAYRFICSVLKENEITAPAVKLPAAAPKERDFLQPEEIPVFLEKIKDTPVEICALLALHSIRRSEIFALEKKDVDLERGVIHVRGAVVPDENCKYVKKELNKTEKSTRDIPIMIPRLKEAVSAAPEGPLVTEHPDIPRRQIKRACVACGFAPVTLHGLRHSFASLAYHLGLSELETMRIGGWSDYQTMRKIYTHLAEKDAAVAANKMSAFYQQKAEKRKPKRKPAEKSG